MKVFFRFRFVDRAVKCAAVHSFSNCMPCRHIVRAPGLFAEVTDGQLWQPIRAPGWRKTPCCLQLLTSGKQLCQKMQRKEWAILSASLLCTDQSPYQWKSDLVPQRRSIASPVQVLCALAPRVGLRLGAPKKPCATEISQNCCSLRNQSMTARSHILGAPFEAPLYSCGRSGC